MDSLALDASDHFQPRDCSPISFLKSIASRCLCLISGVLSYDIKNASCKRRPVVTLWCFTIVIEKYHSRLDDYGKLLKFDYEKKMEKQNWFCFSIKLLKTKG